MNLVDIGEDPKLTEIDDLGDAVARHALTLPRVDLHHDAVERRTHQRLFAGRLGVVELGLEDADIELDRRPVSFERIDHLAQLGLLALEFLLGNIEFELTHFRCLARARHLERLELGVEFRRPQHRLLDGDLGDAEARAHGLALTFRLRQFGLGVAHHHVGARVIREHGENFVFRDALAVIDAQFGQNAAAGGDVASDHGRTGRRVGIATRDQRPRHPAGVLGAAGLAAGRHPQH